MSPMFAGKTLLPVAVPSKAHTASECRPGVQHGYDELDSFEASHLYSNSLEPAGPGPAAFAADTSLESRASRSVIWSIVATLLPCIDRRAKVHVGPHNLRFVRTLVFILLPCVLFGVFIAPPLAKLSSVHLAFIIVSAYLLLLTLVNATFTAFADPGIVQRPLEAVEADLMSQASLGTIDSSADGIVPAIAGIDDERERRRLWREHHTRHKAERANSTRPRLDSNPAGFCVYCVAPRPSRSSHCRTCNACIKGADHHCPHLNNCIGTRNYGSYFTTLVAGTLLSISGVSLSSYAIHMARCFSSLEGTAEAPLLMHPGSCGVAVGCVIMGFMALITSGWLLGYHTMLWIRRENTRENIKGSRRIKGDFFLLEGLMRPRLD